MTEPTDRPDADAIRATFAWLGHAAHGVSEVRVIHPQRGVVGLGFFDEADAFVDACARSNVLGNVYVGIQPRPAALGVHARNALRPLRAGAGARDVAVVTATVIDIDPVRPKDVASTEAELAAALEAADRAAAWCESEGLVRPLRMMSRNGAQLWFAVPPIALTDANRDAVRANLRAFEATVRAQVESPAVKVDSIHDLARIIKVVGTVARKGASTAERPHRQARALEGFERREDAALAARLLAPAAPAAPRRLPLLEPGHDTATARRTEAGELWWEAPVEMCGPVQRLWDQGCTDRSLAIFDMVRFFAHKGLPLEEVTALVLEYDRRGLGKLAQRDGAAEIRRCYEKVLASRREDGAVAPPCHSLQRIGYCRVNREPGVRCEVYDAVFDVGAAIAALPTDAPDVEYRIKPILDAIAHEDADAQARDLAALGARTRLNEGALRQALRRSQVAQAEARDAPPPGEGEAAAGLEGEIFEGAACYLARGRRREAHVISSFRIEPTLRVQTDAGEILVGDAVTDRGAVVRGIRLPLSAFHSKRDLIRQLPSADLQWTGSDNNVQGLLRVLSGRDVPRRRGVSVLGFHVHDGAPLWVCPGGAIGTAGFCDPPPVVYLPNGGALEGRVRYEPTEDAAFRALAAEFFGAVLEVNDPEVVLPLLGWFFATPLKPRVMADLGAFPLLFLWGTAGSGKSSLLTEVFWPLFGVREADGRDQAFSATETEFALLHLLGSTNAVPVVLDEYKPGDMASGRLNQLHRFLRRAYRGEVDGRGRKDQTIQSYRVTAPVCLAGETRPTEQALQERALIANPTRDAVDRAACRAAFAALRALPLHRLAPRYVQFCLGRDVAADLAVARAVAARLIGGRAVPERPALNVVVMLLGLHLFEQFARWCGYAALPADLGARRAVDAVLREVFDQDERIADALDRFVEMLGVMAVQGELRHRTHYVFREGRLFVHVESAYDAFRQHCRRIDHRGELLDLRALRRLAKENHARGGYVVAESELVYFKPGSDRRRAIGIDLGRTTVVTAADFPTGEPGEPGLRDVPRFGSN